jgi:hypothetical protein
MLLFLPYILHYVQIILILDDINCGYTWLFIFNTYV